MNKIIVFSVVATSSIILVACSIASPINDAEKSGSYIEATGYEAIVQFDYSTDEQYRDLKKYRIFHQASTGFVSKQSIRESLHKRAESFCKNKGEKKPVIIKELASGSVMIPGNFPKVEAVFVCMDNEFSNSNNRYDEIFRLKELLDGGAITQNEYDVEKKKLLSK